MGNFYLQSRVMWPSSAHARHFTSPLPLLFEHCELAPYYLLYYYIHHQQLRPGFPHSTLSCHVMVLVCRKSLHSTTCDGHHDNVIKTHFSCHAGSNTFLNQCTLQAIATITVFLHKGALGNASQHVVYPTFLTALPFLGMPQIGVRQEESNRHHEVGSW